MKKETIVTGVKVIVGIGITIGVTILVKNAVKIIAPQNMNVVKKVCVWMTGVLIAGVVDKVVSDYTNEAIDDITNVIEAGAKEIKEAYIQEKA